MRAPVAWFCANTFVSAVSRNRISIYGRWMLAAMFDWYAPKPPRPVVAHVFDTGVSRLAGLITNGPHQMRVFAATAGPWVIVPLTVASSRRQLAPAATPPQVKLAAAVP